MAAKKKVRAMSSKEKISAAILILGILILSSLLINQGGFSKNSLSSQSIPDRSSTDNTQSTESPSTNSPSTTEPSSTADSPSTTEPSTTTPASTTDCSGTFDVGVRWNFNPEPDISYYKVMWGTGSGNYSHSAQTSTGAENRLRAGPLLYNTTYYFVVQAFIGTTPSLPSDEKVYMRPCPPAGDTFEPDPVTFPPVPIRAGSGGVDLPVPYPGLPPVKIPPPPADFDCPPPKVVVAQITSMKLMYSHDLVNWSEYTVPAEGFDKERAKDELGMPVFFTVEVVYDYVCVDSESPTPGRSSVLQSSSVGDVFIEENIATPKESFWSRLIHFFTSLFTWDFSSLTSDIVVVAPSQPKGLSMYGETKRAIEISAKEFSSGDMIQISGAGFLGVVSDLATPLKISAFEGTELQFTATAGPNSSFVGWQGCTSAVGKVCTVVVDGNEAITSVFEPLKRFTLTTTNAGTGIGRIIGISGTSQTYTSGTSVTLTAVPATNSTFIGWSGDCTGVGPCKISIDGNKNAIATFAILAKYTLTTHKIGTGIGNIFSSPLGINCGTDCSEQYTQNTWITLTPSLTPLGTVFSGWSGACSGTGPCSLQITENKAISATFTTVPTYTLTATKKGTGTGTITSSIAGVNCGTDCSEVYNQNVIVTLNSIPDYGMHHAAWVGCTSVFGTTCTVSMNAAKTVTATFNRPTYALTINKAGSGTGTALGTIGASAGFSSGNFPIGSTIKIVATPATGSTFTGWTGCPSVSGTICTVTMNSAKTVTANFSLPATYTVKINISGTGSGLVRWGTTGTGAISGTTTYTKILSVKRGATFQYSAEPYKGTATPIITGTCKTSTGTGSCTVNSDKTIDIKFTDI